MNDYCSDFECALMGKCINADNLCNDLQDCRRIGVNKCSMCMYESVCVRKEKVKDGKND